MKHDKYTRYGRRTRPRYRRDVTEAPEGAGRHPDAAHFLRDGGARLLRETHAGDIKISLWESPQGSKRVLIMVERGEAWAQHGTEPEQSSVIMGMLEGRTP